MESKNYTDGKMVLLGDMGAGKTSLSYRYKLDKFTEKPESTIGATFSTYNVYSKKYDEFARLNLWDTAGQERFHVILPMYIRGADIVLLCCEKFDRLSLNKYIETVRRLEMNKKIEIILVVTKSDVGLTSSEKAELANYAETRSFPLFYTSSKTGEGVKELFEKTAEILIEMKNKNITEQVYDIISLKEEKEETVKSGRCC